MKALYIHIPFCDSICSYCDFSKRVSSDVIKNRYIKSLIKEIEYNKDHYNSLETIFIGGGTPSSLNISQLKELFNALNSNINLSKIKEFSFESNPESLSLDKIELLKQYYVNRVSLGVQTFDDESLKLLNRKHTKQIVFDVINNLNSIGINNINIDLIFSIPNTSIEHVKKDLEIANKLKITHISYYSLILEEKTIFNHLVNQNILELINNDIEADMFEFIINNMKEKGYKQYEISNFSKEGYQSAHNLVYWDFQPYLGIGLNSSSFNLSNRTTNIGDLIQYNEINNNDYILNNIKLNKEDLISEYIIMGLRKIEGINIQKINNQFEFDLLQHYPVIERLIKQGFLSIDSGYLSLTKKGLFNGNNIFIEFI